MNAIDVCPEKGRSDCGDFDVKPREPPTQFETNVSLDHSV